MPYFIVFLPNATPTGYFHMSELYVPVLMFVWLCFVLVSVFMFVGLFVCLFIHLYICLPVCPSGLGLCSTFTCLSVCGVPDLGLGLP